MNVGEWHATNKIKWTTLNRASRGEKEPVWALLWLRDLGRRGVIAHFSCCARRVPPTFIEEKLKNCYAA